MSWRIRLTCALLIAVVYSLYLWHSVRAIRHDSVPIHQYEQILAQMEAWSKGKKHGPLDQVQVLADVREWLDSLGEDRL